MDAITKLIVDGTNITNMQSLCQTLSVLFHKEKYSFRTHYKQIEVHNKTAFDKCKV